MSEVLTHHMLDAKITRAEAFEIFRKEFFSVKLLVKDDCLNYGPYDKKFAYSTEETAKALIKRKNLPLKVRIEYSQLTFTMIIEER